MIREMSAPLTEELHIAPPYAMHLFIRAILLFRAYLFLFAVFPLWVYSTLLYKDFVVVAANSGLYMPTYSGVG